MVAVLVASDSVVEDGAEDSATSEVCPSKAFCFIATGNKIKNRKWFWKALR